MTFALTALLVLTVLALIFAISLLVGAIHDYGAINAIGIDKHVREKRVSDVLEHRRHMAQLCMKVSQLLLLTGVISAVMFAPQGDTRSNFTTYALMAVVALIALSVFHERWATSRVIDSLIMERNEDEGELQEALELYCSKLDCPVREVDDWAKGKGRNPEQEPDT